MSMKYKIGLTKEDWSEVVGWLRNGNHDARDLADHIDKMVDKLEVIADAEGWVQDIKDDPKLFSPADLARAEHYVKLVKEDLKKLEAQNGNV